MNRRNFLIAVSASVGLFGQRAFAQNGEENADVFISELTGAEIDFSKSSLEMAKHRIDADEGRENVFCALNRGVVRFVFTPQSPGNAKDFVDKSVSELDFLDGVKLLNKDDFEDGGWRVFTASNDKFGYFEYQLNAFQGYDLVVQYNTEVDEFLNILDEIQAIKIDGFEPFLFLEDSNLIDQFNSWRGESAPAAAATTSRRRRGSSSSATESQSSTSDSDEGKDSGSPATNTRDDASATVQAVTDHRDAFIDSYETFIAQIGIVADDASTEDESSNALMLAMNEAFKWQVYPDDAAKVSFAPGLEGLQSLYLEWADAVSQVGFAAENVLLKGSPYEEFESAFKDAVTATQALNTELDALTRS